MKQTRLRKWNATAAYTLQQIATWSFHAVIITFSSNVLRDYGFTDSRISALLGIATACSFVLQLALAELVSRSKAKVWGVLAVLGTAMLVCSQLVRMPGLPSWAAIAAFGVACMTLQMIPSFTNAMGMDAIKRGSPTNYSFARGMGSLGYSVLSFGMGRLVGSFGSGVVPMAASVCGAVLVAAVVWYHFAGERNLEEPVSAAAEEKGQEKGFFVQYPQFAVFLVASVLLQLSHNLLASFMYQIMLVKNGSAAEQGTANAICALVEIPVMVFFPLLMRRIRCDKWVRFSSLFIAVKSIGVFLAGTPGGVFAAQATQILGYGLYTISSVNYAEMVVGRGESVRAQSYLGATVTVGTLLAASTGGVICEYFGAQTMVLVSLAAGLLGGITIALTAQRTKQ